MNRSLYLAVAATSIVAACHASNTGIHADRAADARADAHADARRDTSRRDGRIADSAIPVDLHIPDGLADGITDVGCTGTTVGPRQLFEDYCKWSTSMTCFLDHPPTDGF